MRKKWLSLLLVFCFLMAAGSAFGAVAVPKQLNGTWCMTGIQSTNSTAAGSIASVFMSFNNLSVWANASGYGPHDAGGGINGTLYVWNQTSYEGCANSTNLFDEDDNSWATENTGPLGKMDGLLKLTLPFSGKVANTTSAYYFAANPDYSFMAGLANGTVNGTRTAWDTTSSYPSAPNVALMYKNQTIANGLTINGQTVNALSDMISGTWYYYSLGTANCTTGVTGNTAYVARLGRLTFATSTTGTATLYVANSSGSFETTGEAITQNVVYALSNGTNNYVTISNMTGATTGGNFTLFTNATLTRSRNILVGFTGGSQADTEQSVNLAVAIRGGTVLTENDFKNGAFKYIAFGKGIDPYTTGAANATARIGSFITNDALKVTTGNHTAYGTVQDMATDAISTGVTGATYVNLSIEDYNWAVDTSAALNGITHGNATLRHTHADGVTNTNSTFLGRKVDNVMFGIYTNATELSFMMVFPAAMQVGDFTNISAAANNTIGTQLATGVTQANYVRDAPEAGWDGSDDEVCALSAAELARRFAGVAVGTVNIPLNTFWHEVNGGADAVYVSYYTFKGGVQGKTIANLGTFSKLYTNQTSTDDALGNTTKAFAYRSPGTDINDGQWWITRDSDLETTPMQTNAALYDHVTYRVYTAIADNGDYDADDRVNYVRDPSGGVPLVGGADEGSSDDDGCVFNPAASMSLEFLLLLLVPVAYLIRRRKK